MRRVVLLCLGAVLMVPATAAAVGSAGGDGTLTVRNGDGSVRVNLRTGVVLGRVGAGTLEIVDPEVECDDLDVWGDRDDTPTERPLRSRDGVACVFKGRDMRFRLIEDDSEVRTKGRGLWLSVVGRGKAYLQGSPSRFRDGVYSVNGAKPASLPDDGAWVQIAAPTSLT